MSNTKTEQPVLWNFPVNANCGSETGLREENQDAAANFSSPFGMAYLVADGMGGHKGGAEAARLTAESFRRCLTSLPGQTPFAEAVSCAATEAHKALFDLGNSGDPNFTGMGSTVALAVIRQTGVEFELLTAHMGDSRVYLHRAGQLVQLTRDHTQVQWLVDAREIDEESARLHPDASVLTRALGHGSNPLIDVSEPIPLGDADGILLCSDGLSGFVSGDEIGATIGQYPDPAVCVPELIKLAMNRGSNDNITIQFIRVGSTPAPVYPIPRVSRRTVPESLAASTPLPRAAVGGSMKKALLIAGVAAAVALAGGAIFALGDKWLRAHESVNVTSSLATDIDALNGESATLSGDARRAERQTAEALRSASAALPRKSGQEIKARIDSLKQEFHDVDKIASEVHETAVTLQHTLTLKTNTADLQKYPGDAVLKTRIADAKKKLSEARDQFNKARDELGKASPVDSRKDGR